MDQRKKPFTEFERSFLMNLIQQHADIVENKKTDGVSLGKKAMAWTRITDEFNASSRILVKTDTKKLKKLWNNMKAKSREAKTKENQRNFTGGGPSIPDMDPEHTHVLSIVPNILPVIKVIDSDAVIGKEDDDDSEYWEHVKNRSNKNQKTIQKSQKLIDVDNKVIPDIPILLTDIMDRCEAKITPSSLSIPIAVTGPSEVCGNETICSTANETSTADNAVSSNLNRTPFNLKRRLYTNRDSVENYKIKIMEQDLKQRAERFELEKIHLLRIQALEIEHKKKMFCLCEEEITLKIEMLKNKNTDKKNYNCLLFQYTVKNGTVKKNICKDILSNV